MSGGVVDYANAGFITEQDGEAMSETPYSIVHHGVAYVLADALESAEADNAALLTLIRSISYRLNGGLHDSITVAIAAECDALLAGKSG